MSARPGKSGERAPDHGKARPGGLYLGDTRRKRAGEGRDSEMSATGLQKLAFFLLLALILYVSFTGGG